MGYQYLGAVNAESSTVPQQSNGSRQRIPSTTFQKPRQYQTVTHHDKLMNYHKSPPFLIISVKTSFSHLFYTTSNISHILHGLVKNNPIYLLLPEFVFWNL